MNNRTVVKFENQQTIETLMAYTYGHSIPLTVQTVVENKRPTFTLQVSESIPDRLVESAKQVCYMGCQRYRNG